MSRGPIKFPWIVIPKDRQLWLILRASGKHVSSFDAIADALQQSMLAMLDDVAEEARRVIPGVLHIPFFHGLFKRREVRLYGEVRSALEKLTKTIEYVRFWQGSVETRSLEQSTKADSSQEAEVQLKGQLKQEGRGRRDRGRRAQARVRGAAPGSRAGGDPAARRALRVPGPGVVGDAIAARGGVDGRGDGLAGDGDTLRGRGPGAVRAGAGGERYGSVPRGALGGGGVAAPRG